MSKKPYQDKLENQIIKNIKSFISFIESKNLYYYIGQTNEPDRRLKEHYKTKGFKELFVLVKHSKETIDYLEHYIISLYFDNKYCLNTQNYSKIIKDDICFKPYKSNDFFVYVSLKDQIDINTINKNISLINVFSIINKNNNISVISLINNDINDLNNSSSISTLSKSLTNTSTITSTSTTNSSYTISLSSEDEIIDETFKEIDKNKKEKITKDTKDKNDLNVKGDLKQLPTKKSTKSTIKSSNSKCKDIKETKDKNIKETKDKNIKETKDKNIKEKEIKEKKDNKKEIKQIEIIDKEKVNNTVKNLIQIINKNIIRKEGVKDNKYIRIDLCKDYKYIMHKICYKKKIDDDNIKQLYKSSNKLELSQIFYELKKYYHYQKEINIKLDNFFCFLSTIHSSKDNNIIYFYLY